MFRVGDRLAWGLVLAFGLLLAAAGLVAPAANGAPMPTACSGDAFAALVTDGIVVGPFAAVGPLADCSDVQEATQASLSNPLTLPNSLTASALHAKTTGGNPTHSEASLANLDLLLAGNHITADAVSASAVAECTLSGPVVSGSSVITNLVVNTIPVTASGSPNQNVTVGPVVIVINQQTSSIGGNTGTMTVNALHITIGAEDAIISHVHADVTCNTDTPTLTPTNTPTATPTPTNTPTATPTPTNTPPSPATPVLGPIRVGGIADLHIGADPGSRAAVAGSGGSGIGRSMAISLATAVVLSMTAGGWYLRRRVRR